MDNGTEDFDKLRKLLKLKRYEQPPPGYFGRFSGLVITRIEREAESEGAWAEAPWLKKFLRIIESSPVVGGLFGSGLCALVIFGIAMANQADKISTGPFSPVANVAGGPGGNDFIASSGQSEAAAHSTDAMFGSNIISSPFVADGSVTASLEPASFIKPPQ
jgi:hypothetical protein